MVQNSMFLAFEHSLSTTKKRTILYRIFIFWCVYVVFLIDNSKSGWRISVFKIEILYEPVTDVAKSYTILGQ